MRTFFVAIICRFAPPPNSPPPKINKYFENRKKKPPGCCGKIFPEAVEDEENMSVASLKGLLHQFEFGVTWYSWKEQ
jgi:hypothetical protein